MTTFEKIYWTSWIVSILLWFLGVYFECEFDVDTVIVICKCFLELEVIFIVGYWIVKVICWIWGVHISLFPSIK